MKTSLALVLAIAAIVSACGSDSPVEVSSDDAEPDSSLPSTEPSSTPEDLPLGAGPFPIADLTIAVDLDGTGNPTTYRLACLGDTATFTGDNPGLDAATACLALWTPEVNERLTLQTPEARMCT